MVDVAGARVAPLEPGHPVVALPGRVAPVARGPLLVAIAAPVVPTGAAPAHAVVSVGAATTARTAAARLARRDEASEAALGWALPWSVRSAGLPCPPI